MHSRILSDASTLTVLSEEYQDQTVTTEERENEALVHLHSFSLRLEEQRIIPNSSVDSLKILTAMLKHAPAEAGRRYVACAILSCKQEPEELVNLASDWLVFLLWPFKSAHKESFHPSSSFSTPMLDSTQVEINGVAERGKASLVTQLKLRQGNECAVIDLRPNQVVFIAAHIIRRSLAKRDESAAGIHPSLTVTWDILRNYADLSEDVIQTLGDTIDSPGNGILLEAGMHCAFDEYKWCFEPTDQPNVYQVRWLTDPLHLFESCRRTTIKFENKSERPIALPNPKFLQIHASIAKVLNSTGVGEYLDLVIDTFHPGSSPVLPEQLGAPDLDLRLSVLSLATALSNSPAESYV